MPETGENVAQEHGIARQVQDAFALRSQQRAAAAQADGWVAEEIAPVTVTDRKGRETVIAADEHLRPDTSAERLAKLAPLVRADGTVTAGNASGVNDGAAAMIVASAAAARAHGLRPRARILGMTRDRTSTRLNSSH